MAQDRRSPYRQVGPLDINPPDQRVMQAFPLQGQTSQPAFAPALVIAVGRGRIAALGKLQLYNNTFPCQKVLLLNEGAGDLVWGINGVNLNAPALGQVVGNGFLLVAGAAKDIWVNDAQYIWVGSVAGTLLSFEVTGTSIPASLLNQPVRAGP